VRYRATYVTPFDGGIRRTSATALTLDTPNVASSADLAMTDRRGIEVKLFSSQIRESG